MQGKFEILRYDMKKQLELVQAQRVRNIEEKRNAKALRISPVILTQEEKKAVQQFYSTNAGTDFINTRLRNSYPGSTLQLKEKYPIIDAAIAVGSNEDAGEICVMFSGGTKTAIRTAFSKGGVREVVLAALYDADKQLSVGEYLGDAYRGTRVPADLLAQFKAGDVMINTFVTSFSVDMFKSAMREGETDKKLNDGFVEAVKFTKDNYKSHTGVPVIYKKPRHANYNITLIHGVYENEAVIPPGTKFEIDTIQNKGTYTLITLRTAGAGKKAVRPMNY